MHTRWTPRALLTIALAAIVVLVGVMGWLGWLLFVQDQALERQRITERLDHGADLAIAALSRELKATLDHLAAAATAPDALQSEAAQKFLGADDVVLVVMGEESLRSSAPLPFYPGESEPADSSLATFAEVEAVELAGRDLTGVLASYQRLTASSDAEVRAGGLVRLGRVARKLGKTDVALAAYDNLARLGSTPAMGRPSDLLAAIERCAVLYEGGHRAELQKASATLELALRAGRWRLTRGEYFAHLDSIRKWIGQGPTPTIASEIGETLAHGAAAAWHEQSRDKSFASEGWRSVPGLNSPVMLARHGEVALVVTRGYADRVWFRELADVGRRQRARFTIAGEAGEFWREGGPTVSAGVHRTSQDSGLPFSLTVTTDDPAGDTAGFSGRRWLWAGMFSTLGLLLIGGGYIVARSLAKELEVARLQSDFVAAVSHEFRTPVASMRQLSEVLDEGRVPDEERRTRYYGLLRRESERLQRLVEGLLDFRRMESGSAEYRFEVLDPAALVKNVADEFHGGAHPGRRLVTSTPSELPHVRADSEAIARALWNLLDNAVKYSPPDSEISLEAAATGGHVEIRVTDRGSGVPPSERQRIFEKFVRGESARVTGAKGTGLGLSMVSSIMRAHHGEVRVHDGAGCGATFILVLPVEGGTA